MDDSDEVYSELEFQQDENQMQSSPGRKVPQAAVAANSDDDNYSDEFIEDEIKVESSEKTDLGSVAKVAKKEGVIEVVEVDDGHEKVISSGSPFSEISVKDEAQEEEEEHKAAGKILLDDQSEVQMEQVRGAVKKVQVPTGLETCGTTIQRSMTEQMSNPPILANQQQH